MEILVYYVVGYACKGEISSKDAVNMFWTLIHNGSITGLTQFPSLSQRLNIIVFKSCELSATEFLFALQGLQYFHSSSSTGRIILNVGVREYASENEAEEDIDISVKLNQFDKFSKGKTEVTVGEFVSFHMYNCSR